MHIRHRHLPHSSRLRHAGDPAAPARRPALQRTTFLGALVSAPLLVVGLAAVAPASAADATCVVTSADSDPITVSMSDASGNGTDCTTAIQGAIDDASTGANGDDSHTVKFAVGEYPVTHLVVKSNVTLQGPDTGTAMLQQETLALGTDQGPTPNDKLLDLTNVHDVKIEKLTLDGTGGLEPSTGIDANGVQGLTLSDIVVKKFLKNGISITGKYTRSDVATSNVVFDDVTSTGNGWDGIAFFTNNHDYSLPRTPAVHSTISDVVFSGRTILSDNVGPALLFDGFQTNPTFSDDGHSMTGGTIGSPVWPVQGPYGGSINLGVVDFGSAPETPWAPILATDGTQIVISSASQLDGKSLVQSALAGAPYGAALLDGSEVTVARPGPVGTNLNHLWTNDDTRPGGSFAYESQGLHAQTTTSSAKVALGTSASFPLADAGVLNIGWNAVSGGTPPSINLKVAVTDEQGKEHFGTLVYEDVYGQSLWLTTSGGKTNDYFASLAPHTGGGNGSKWFGTASEWANSLGNSAMVTEVAFALGSGVQGDGYLTSLTANGVTYGFTRVDSAPSAPSAPSAAPVTAQVAAGGSASSSPTGSTVPTAQNPVVATVTSPVKGDVTFTPSTKPAAPQAGYTMAGQSFTIDAPVATPDNPLQLGFALDDAALPAGADPADVTVFRDGVAIAKCAVANATVADPDPCVASLTVTNGVTHVKVLSAHASVWTFGVAQPGPFTDVPADAQFAQAIGWLKDQKITTGFADKTFRPVNKITREAVAAFLYRAAHDGKDAAAPATKPFADVDTTAQFAGDIAWLKDQKITTGFSGNVFKPTVQITREALAAFLYRMDNKGKTAPAPTVQPFTDVDTTAQFAGDIAWLKDQKITTGFADHTFRPTNKITREAVAAFLYRQK